MQKQLNQMQEAKRSKSAQNHTQMMKYSQMKEFLMHITYSDVDVQVSDD